MKKLLIMVVLYSIMGCSATQKASIEQPPSQEVLISKDDERESEAPMFELLPHQDALENDEKVFRITLSDGRSGEATIAKGYEACATLLFSAVYYARQYNILVNQLMQLDEAEIGLSVELPPFLEIRKQLPYHHRIEQEEE